MSTQRERDGERASLETNEFQSAVSTKTQLMKLRCKIKTYINHFILNMYFEVSTTLDEALNGSPAGETTQKPAAA